MTEIRGLTPECPNGVPHFPYRILYTVFDLIERDRESGREREREREREKERKREREKEIERKREREREKAREREREREREINYLAKGFLDTQHKVGIDFGLKRWNLATKIETETEIGTVSLSS